MAQCIMKWYYISYIYEWYEKDDDVYVYVWMIWRRWCLCIYMDGMKKMMLHKHAWHMTLRWWDLFIWVLILDVFVCLCAGDATAHNVYRYEWLHIIFYDNF
jgi:hypothetical protein